MDLQTYRKSLVLAEQHMGICSDYLVKPQRVNFAVRIVDINGKVLEKEKV